MQDHASRAIAIVGAGAVLPDAPNVSAFWRNVREGRYSISEVQPDRWDPALYYDEDPSAPDKTYSKIGGWVRDYVWDPIHWRLPVPPRVVEGMDEAQKWAIACTREAFEDCGSAKRKFDPDRTAVILGNAMAGEKHYLTAIRLYFPEFAHELEMAESFAALPEALRHDITRELHRRLTSRLPDVTEDTMPGELANCIAGRIANLFNFHGPNYVVDAACASAMAAISAAVEGLVEHDFDLAVTGGIDRNMGASTYIKFCKIGALSATGTRPYAAGADGFVMGEGAAIFLLKRLADAEHDGDSIYAVIRGIGGSSDGKGKGITAPNPIGQKFCIERAWQNAGLSPAAAGLIEGHGTSTRVGDVVEANSLVDVLAPFAMPTGSIALGSVKSNIGHLKGAAGAAGILKAALALRDKVLPPSVHCDRPNPDIDFAHSPLRVNTELASWTVSNGNVRTAGVSAFGFGGTNFHVVMEEYVPGRISANGKTSIAAGAGTDARPHTSPAKAKAPMRGALVVGADSPSALAVRLEEFRSAAALGRAPEPCAPRESDLRAPERIAIDYADAAELADKAGKALKALAANQPAAWKALRPQGIFRGHGPAPKVAMLYTGQGSQYVNMLRQLRSADAIVASTFDEADRAMTPLLGKSLTEYIFVDKLDPAAVAQAEDDLRQTAITQPAVLAADAALTRLLAAYGIEPDFTMGHSLGEYGALVAAGALPFEEALEAVSARGREMSRVSVRDNGRMAAVFAPIPEIERALSEIDGYVVIANINSDRQAVIGGGSLAVEAAMKRLADGGYEVVPLPVSHAFHTSIVAPASGPLREMLVRLNLRPPRIPVVANNSGDFYPRTADAVPRMIDILGQQIASPVQFVKGLHTLYEAGARLFIEVGPKKALQGFAEDVLGSRDDVVALFTNHPKLGDVPAFNQALCGLYAAGLGRGEADSPHATSARPATTVSVVSSLADAPGPILTPHTPAADSVVVTGAALGLPGTERVFDEGNLARILRGEQLIDVIPMRLRRAMANKHITRLVKTDNGAPTFEAISDVSDVIKLAGRGGAFDLEHEYGVPADRIPALDRVTKLAIAVGIDALRDAGIPLVMRYKATRKGTQLPDRWMLPEELRDETGILFASAFPGYDSLIGEINRYHEDKARREELATLEALRSQMNGSNTAAGVLQLVEQRITDKRAEVERQAYVFDRRFIFKVLAMGHSQFAEYIGARGPNAHINGACASSTQSVALAEGWIREGRCRRVIIVSADDVASDQMIEWMGAGFLASGAAATDERVEDAAVPFDRRRHGMILGMGAAAMVLESADAARERGLRPICEVMAAVAANSAFHGTRLDVEHIKQVMERLLTRAEARGFKRDAAASRTVFVSHETYTPARGGSAAAEVAALRAAFGDHAREIVVANTKGITGHAMATGIEDVVAIKALETGWVPPVANFKEVDPDLGPLNLSKGSVYPVEYALRLGAGFGSQIGMTLMRWVASKDGSRPGPNAVGYRHRIEDPAAWKSWLARITGDPGAEVEVVQRTLRIRSRAQAPAPVAAEPAAPPVAEPAPAAAPKGAPATAVPANDPVEDRIIALVVETTGYPREMLELDLDLEADLGVDTVKQAELFGAIRESYGIERDANLKLRDFPTLKHVIRFVHDRRPDLATPAATPAAAVTRTDDSVREQVLDIVAATTGYPKDMLDLDLDLEADLGVDTVKQAEMFAAVREMYGIERDPNLKLRDFPTIARVIQFVEERRRPAAAVPSPAPVSAIETDGVREQVLDIVAAKTGYPKEMLDLDLDLEADLGVDTVKQAEMFAAVREIYGIERDANLKLRAFPTIARVIQFVEERRRPTVAAPPPAAPPAAETDAVQEKVLEIVAAKTGYPKEMLDLDLDLESDLGIDTVKQAETFAAVREAYSIPRIENLKLRDFPTLAHVIQFARDHQNGSHRNATPETAEPAPQLGDLAVANIVPRRVPVPVLRPPTAMCKQTGVSLAAGSRVVLMPDQGGVAEVLTAALRAMGVEVVSPDEAPGSVDGVYWLAGLDEEVSLTAMSVDAWRQALHVRVKRLYATMRSLYGQVARPGTFLVAATRLGGQHGFNAAGATAPIGGAITGFTKTYKRERRDVLVKAVDFELGRDAADVAALLVDETLRDPGAVEVGYRDGLRWGVGLEERPAADGQPGMTLNKSSVFVITGAAGSIVSAITADLARASAGTFYLLDLVPEPDPNDADVRLFASDKEALKRELFARIQARGQRATPALIEKELARLERAHAARTCIDAVKAAGGTAHYRSVNLTDASAVAAVIEEVRERSGRIDALLHAAGMERSHMLPDKAPAEFDLVFDVKANGWFHLLHAIGDMPLGAAVVFSSIAGRFGNAGQTDYSSANDLLAKIVSSFRTTRPATRGIAIDWTAWGGIGMATRGSIPKMMEMAGIDMLPPEAGIPVVRRELTCGGTRGELVIAQRLGILMNEWDEAGGLDSAAVQRTGPMTGAVRASVHGMVSVETTLDPAQQPFLHDHQIEGTPVLPGVMGVEAFAEAARSLLPGWRIAAVEDMNFLAPFKFYRNEPRAVTVEAVLKPCEGGIMADCRLIGRRTLPNQSEPQVTTHFTGRVLLTQHAAETPCDLAPVEPASPAISQAGIYNVYFHGPAYRVLEAVWLADGKAIGRFAANLPPNHWPLELPLATAPRLLELCFQTASIQEIVEQQRMGLPLRIERVVFYDTPIVDAAPVYAVVTREAASGSTDATVVDAAGRRHLTMSGYRTVALPTAVDAAALQVRAAVSA